MNLERTVKALVGSKPNKSAKRKKALVNIKKTAKRAATARRTGNFATAQQAEKTLSGQIDRAKKNGWKKGATTAKRTGTKQGKRPKRAKKG